MARLKTILSEPRYLDLVLKYQSDWTTFAAVLIDKKPTWQQRQIIAETQQRGARVSVSSGHGTGKSDMTSIMILAFIILNPESRVVVVANNAAQVRNVIWKYIKTNFKTLCRNLPWIESYFALNEREFYAVGYKGVWSCIAKSARRGNEEALAGEHCHTYLVVVDEASGIPDKALQVLSSALTESNNNMCMLSQPTRNSGFFYDSHHRLAKTHKNPNGIWTAIRLNSEESPLVSPSFISEKLVSYGGEDSPEYQIKVMGCFPSSLEGYLLSRKDCELAANSKPNLDKHEWGWVAACDVGNGRDKSVINICKVSLGPAEQRVVINVDIIEMKSNIDPIDFGHEIKKHVEPYILQNITVLIDGDGVGFATVKVTKELGLNVQEVRWGKPLFNNKLRSRFINQRAYAHIMMRDAIKTGRLKIDQDENTKSQISKIPVQLNESGKWVICSKKEMREVHNLKSPDRSDTYCFMFLANPSNAECIDLNNVVEEEFLDFLN
ncbi:terminase [Psychrosphaera ytuae]|uniref:Terminase n=1 Tax=Psychrosphaera ytuae TaxID=2820710 RepID=A0A975DA39_9GAMM|nr:terminase [Psychrosphaera ytuae]QTH63347.1 terminase [Psychrosphaera ytuae]